MEKRKETLSLLRLCRFCLSQDETLTSLYDGAPTPKNPVNLAQKILSSISVEVFPSDKMPTFICARCRMLMNICYEYKQICRQVDENIFQYIQSGTQIKKVQWPAILTKILAKCDLKSNNKPANSVLETTLQVSSHVLSDSEEDNENVINVKIEGPNDNSKNNTCINMINKNDQLKLTRMKPELNKESGGTLRWACDECERTYPLRQLLTLHKQQKHRERTHECNLCHECQICRMQSASFVFKLSKFFSKNDLATHQSACHYDDCEEFSCAVCDKTFKRQVLLKRHEKYQHAQLLRHKCDNCPASFLSFEELETHQSKHVTLNKPFICYVCDKRFHSKTARRRHLDVIHNGKLDFVCEYCPDKFSSGTKLARHIRTHAGERPYPCKYCNKSFMKSHHYTRHLRLKHSEAHPRARGAAAADGGARDADAEALRCEQCDESFATQDDLIYHSAIHATQNLICPLCQEKFDNVDEVTAHIKSHVSGEEFTCDFCELMFVSNEKLEKHVADAHDDEINEQEMVLDESSMDIKDEDSESGIIDQQKNIKPRNEFMISNKDGDSDEKVNNTNSEESESEMIYTELATVDTLAMIKKVSPVKMVQGRPKEAVAVAAAGNSDKSTKQTASILRKAEEIKRKTSLPAETTSVKVSNAASASDKSLRLLEKELQDLKRTNSRNDVSKIPGKSVDTMRTKRVVTSTPKPRIEERKSQVLLYKTTGDKKLPERRGIKENKEPREGKGKEGNGAIKDDVKEKEIKTIVKNGGGDKSLEEKVRRSSRQSKIKDYAKMSQGDDDDDDDDSEDSDDEEYIEAEKAENRSKIRRTAGKGAAPAASPAPAPAPAPATAPAPAPLRKRGRPRKETKDVPNKVKKINEDDDEDEETDKVAEDSKAVESVHLEDKSEREVKTPVNEESKLDVTKRISPEQKLSSGSVLMSPSGQTLKKVPVKCLPPGVRPLRLPMNARPINTGELCEMQIGKKLVKVQKIVMTKAEVEAMAKKGLVEMKDGTMVLKQGIKLPTTDPAAIKSALVGDADVSKETALKPTPARCDLEEE